MGRTIRVYLVDSTPAGIRTAEIVNWTGSVLVTPRSQLAEIASRGEVKRTGVYFLVGDDPSTLNKKRVYIGEADNVFERLRTHGRDASKDFWTDTVLITSKDLNLTKAHVRFLESRLIGLAREADRASLDNGTAPEDPSLPESDISDMAEFLEQVQVVLPVLGFQFLQRSAAAQLSSASASNNAAPDFELKQGMITATAREIDGEFIVLRGSMARRETQPSWTFFKAGREALEHDRKLVLGDDAASLVFAQDVPFSSPSAAAATVLARNANGRTEWKHVGSGLTYQKCAEQQLEQAKTSTDKQAG